MSTYHHNYKAFGAEVLNASWMVVEMRARIERVAALAQSIAPFDPNDKDGDHYRDHFSVDSGTHGGIHHDRAYGRLTNDHVAAMAIEFGSYGKYGRIPGHRTLGKALDAL